MPALALKRRGRAEEIEARIAEIRAAVDDDQAAALEARRLAAAESELRDDLGAREAGGTISRDEVDARLADAAAAVAAHIRTAEARERAASLREQTLPPLLEELAHIRGAARISELKKLADTESSAAASAVRALEDAAAAARAFVAANEATRRLEDELEEELGDLDVDWPAEAEPVETPWRVNRSAIAGRTAVDEAAGSRGLVVFAESSPAGLFTRFVIPDELEPLVRLLLGSGG